MQFLSNTYLNCRCLSAGIVRSIARLFADALFEELTENDGNIMTPALIALSGDLQKPK